MAIIPVNYFINVSITNTPSGLTEKNVNSLALFTTETPSGLDTFTTHVGASTVAELYGTASVTAQMANAVFSQSPNLRTGTGRLVVIPMIAAVSATQGDFTTANISANLNDILLVSDGDINVDVDGVSIDLLGLDFTNATDLDDVATILDGQLANVIVTAVSNTLVFKSKKVGADSDVVISDAGGSGTDLSGAGYFNAAGGTATSGIDASGETLLEAITRMSGAVGFVPVMTNLEMEDDVIEATSDAVQAQDRMFVHHVSSTVDIIGGIGETVQQSGNTRTRLLGYTTSPQAANLYKAAYAGRAFSVNFSGSNTAQTMQFKQLATITPDTGINQTILGQADTNGVDVYISVDGLPCVVSSGGNDYFDNPYNDLALKFALETAGFNYLRQTNTKVPQTEQGMNGLKAAYSGVCVRYVRNGVIAAGSWTSSERFGDPEVFDENIETNGYYTYSEPITQQSAVDREARKAPLVQIAIKRAGAIHSSDVIVLVND